MEIITRYSGLKSRAREIQQHIKDQSFISAGESSCDHPTANLASRVAANLNSCANFLVFNNYYTVDQTKLVKAFTCKQHLVCPFCAARRAARSMAAYSAKIEHVMASNSTLKPAMLTLTVKNGSDLQERFKHLKKSLSRLIERRKDFIKKAWGKTEFRKIDGALYSIEFTHSEEHGWHPHVHMIVLLTDFIDVKKLSAEWESITGDSKIVDIRLIKNKKINSEKIIQNDLSSGLSEVLKYALKFSDLEDPKVWEAYLTLRTKRLMAPLGSLWGVKVPESLLDEPLADLPFVELFYKFDRSKNLYDLKTSTHFDSGVNTPPDPIGMINHSPSGIS